MATNTGRTPRRRWPAAVWLVLVIAMGGTSMLGCGSQRPLGLLGLKWGQSASAAPAALGLQCERWQPWPDMAPYEVCYSGPVRVYGLEAGLIGFVRRGSELAGIELQFKDCAANLSTVYEGLAAELKIKGEMVDYRVWRTGEVLRIQMYGNDCAITVTDGPLGKAYQKEQFRGALYLGPR